MIIDDKQAQEIGFQIYQVVFPEYQPTPGRLPPLAVLESIGRIAFKLVAPKVLEMIRVPSEAMVLAAVEAVDGCDDELEEAWKVMIDKMREDYGG